jgi:diacylglycerol kinase family enzyme
MLNSKIYEAEFVEHFAARRVRIFTEGENHVHLDGEGMVVEGDLNFEVKPAALHILVPKSPAK